MRIAPLAALAVVLVGASACENMNEEQRRAAYGAGIGGVGGAVVGNVTGMGTGTGALLGAGAGAATGALTNRGDVPGENWVRRRVD
ncbi:YMGG-like glycine zipper-containing protein [Arenibaculum pallidiluteum]|uniref:YMGG-like glycine zipper-containing protein n=1 Tax=Arenibaculum pallidiluteum TaxID=2812559 RepID=UPI001A975194|nr:YMGG-like glycine zipper-containing protein [Arenibaculum pallidiluteum]